MHPPFVEHLGASYDLRHLRQTFITFAWNSREGVPATYRLRVRFGRHCYSEETTGTTAEGVWFYREGNRTRSFCPRRHAHSLLLPSIIRSIEDKPSTTIGLTFEKNWSLHVLKMHPPLLKGATYYLFLKIKKDASVLDGDGVRHLDMFVESAYEKTSGRVQVRRKEPFGRVAEAAAQAK